jgi:UDP-N-acetylbacillosamine N-acetyltransferase
LIGHGFRKYTVSAEVIVWGAGGHAKVVIDILLRTGFTLAGLIDDLEPTRRKVRLGDTMVIGDARELTRIYAAGIRQAIVAFGDNTRRMKAVADLESLGFELVRAIHPSATIGMESTVGAGSMIAAGVVLNPSTVVGKSVIVNTCASIDHDSLIRDGAHVGPGATIAGHVEIGERAWIGIGATVIDRKRIGADAIIGAGSVVVDDVPKGVVVMGVPARAVPRLGNLKGKTE